jgi:prevent-host-death family protein
MMKTVSARDANQSFSKLLADVESGEEVVITKHGLPVARLIPLYAPLRGPARAKAFRRMMALMRKGLPLGGLRVKREEIYDRVK